MYVLILVVSCLLVSECIYENAVEKKKFDRITDL